MDSDIHDNECEQDTSGLPVALTGHNACGCVRRADIREQTRLKAILDKWNEEHGRTK